MIALMTTQRSIAYVIGTVIFVGAAFVVLAQMRKGRPEVGSEMELAPNRKPYLADDELEGPKLNIALWGALGMLVVIAVTLPLYWLNEPARMTGAEEYFVGEIFTDRGKETYEVDAQCVNCHGPEGVGGSAAFIITDEAGQFVKDVVWTAPALDNVLYRFSTDEVRDILNYGRPGSPMAAWGTPGGGPMTTQQIDNVIDYLWSIQLTPDEVRAQVDDAVKGLDEGLYNRMIANREANADVADPTGDEYVPMDEADQLLLGEFLFYLDSASTGTNSYSCARCHVPGASYGERWESIDDIARGRMAPNLVGIESNLTPKQHYTLISTGTEFGKSYGSSSIGSGRMPGFGLNANDGADDDLRGFGPAGLFSPEQIWAVVTYERNLSTERAAVTAAATDALAIAAPTEEGLSQ